MTRTHDVRPAPRPGACLRARGERAGRRSLRVPASLSAAVMMLGAGLVGCAAEPRTAHALEPLALTFRGTRNLDLSNVTDQNGVSFTIGGLSGVTYLGLDEYLCVMDNADTLVRARLTLNTTGAITNAQVLAGLRVAQAHDHEGIALGGLQRGTVLLSEEDTPAIREYALDGAAPFVRALTLPAAYANRRANFGLESLTVRLSPAASATGAGATVWTCNEEALTNDGAISTPSTGTLVRITRIDLDGAAGVVGNQWACLTEPMHGPSSIPGARSGVSDLLALPDGRLILLERSLALNFSGFFQARIYELDFAGASPVLGVASLSPPSAPFTPVSKRLLWSGDLSNLEGLTLGPRLSDGSYTLIGVVDDNNASTFETLCSWQLTGVQAPLPGDFDWSGTVSVNDLFVFLNAWFGEQTLTGAGLPADVDQSGFVSVNDLFRFLSDWFGAM